MNLKKLSISVTVHARERLRERFFFKFQRYFDHPRNTESLIIGQVSTAKQLQGWKNVPFYYNMMMTHHGPNTEIMYRSGVFYVCQIQGTRLKVITAMKNFLYYKKENVDNQN